MNLREVQLPLYDDDILLTVCPLLVKMKTESTMSLVSAIVLLIIVIIIYYVLSRLFTALFRLTGIAKEKASFQAISLLTNAGYTTEESELVVSEKTRRHLATAAMLTGYFFSVIIVSLFINLFTTIDFTGTEEQMIPLLVGFGGLAVFFIFLKIPFISRGLDKIMDGITFRVFRKTSKKNYISVLDTYGKDAVVNIYLYRVPEFLEGTCIVDSDLRKKYNVNILMYTRNGQNHYVSPDTIFSNKDTLIAFGPLSSIREAFLLNGNKEHHDKTDIIEDSEGNVITVMSNFGNQVLADLCLNRVPPMLENKSLLESKIKDYFSINIIMVSRGNEPLRITKDTILRKGDRVIAFGPYESISTVFGGHQESAQISVTNGENRN